MNDTRLLQQVLRDLSPHHRSAAGELHLQVLPKATGVVIDDGAGIAKGFHQIIYQNDLLLQGAIIGLEHKNNIYITLEIINWV